MVKKHIILLLFFSLLFTFPFFRNGYFETDDGEWAIVRLAEMSRELRDLQFPPRWSDFLNHGYGYPLFLFTYPFPYYIGSLIHLIGFSLTDSIKMLFVGSVVISSLGMYFFSKRYWGNFGGLISSLLYIFAPYRLVDLYVRGSLGESIALAVSPWLFWATDKYLYKEHKFSILIPILLATLIISHNVSALIFLIIISFYLVIYLSKNRKDSVRVVLPFFQGLLLASYFWIPTLLEKKYIFLGHFPLANRNLHFAKISEVILDNQKSGIKPPLFIGYLHLLVLIISPIVFKKFNQANTRKVLLFSLLTIIFLLFLLFPISQVFWKLPLLNNIDFPWRVLIGVAFLLSFLGGSVTKLSYGKQLGFLIVLLSVLSYFPYTKPKSYFIRSDSYYETNDATTTSNDELMPVWVKRKPTNRPSGKVIVQDGEASDISYSSKNIDFQLKVNANQDVIINTIYFPGWKFFIDKREIDIKPTPNEGLISFNVPVGTHLIKGAFTRTYTRLIADIMSIIGVGFLILSTVEFVKDKYK